MSRLRPSVVAARPQRLVYPGTLQVVTWMQ
jgi:hypothetical protein